MHSRAKCTYSLSINKCDVFCCILKPVMRGLTLQKYQPLHKQNAVCTAIDKVNGHGKETIQSPKCNLCLTKKPKEIQALFFRFFFILFIPLTPWHATYPPTLSLSHSSKQMLRESCIY